MIMFLKKAREKSGSFLLLSLIFFCFCFCIAQKSCYVIGSDAFYSTLDQIDEFAKRRDRQIFYASLYSAWQNGKPTELAQQLTRKQFVELIEKVDSNQLASFASATSAQQCKLFLDIYYPLFIDCLERMTEERAHVYLAALPADFLKIALFDTSPERIEQITSRLSPEKMAVLVTVANTKMDNFTVIKKGSKNNFIRAQAFADAFSLLSLAQINAILSAGSAQLITELFSIFSNSTKK